MPYGETKVYNDGSHYIAIPHTTRPKRKKSKRIKNEKEVKVDEVAEKVLLENKDKSKKEKVQILEQEVNKILKLINQNIQTKFINLEEGNIEEFILSDTFKNGNISKIKNY